MITINSALSSPHPPIPPPSSPLSTQHFPHCFAEASATALSSPHLPIPPSSSPLSTQHFPHCFAEASATALFSPLGTRNSELCTLSPTQHSALYTQHSETHSELGTRNFALLLK
uniref:Uncharacterized protein n=1 Tax=Desertifilum tharense IPPAS B-1220 TaxID=1781255 RepID=A0ACD5GZ21_9CYAN